MIIDDHTSLLCLVYVLISTSSICRIGLCPAAIGRETGHSSCPYIFISAVVLNPSDDMIDQPDHVVIFSTSRAGGAAIFICRELCAYRVLIDTFPCIV